jgi:hypothetical protein
MHTRCRPPHPRYQALGFSHHPWLDAIVPGSNPLEGSSNGPLDTDNNSISQTQQLTTNLLAASMNINSDGHRLLTFFSGVVHGLPFYPWLFCTKASTM